MAVKKSELYSSLWKSCDELRGGMDASQYKDYVLTLLFVKYISDKYKGKKFSAIKVPEGASFDDMVALVGTSNIGDDINKKILNPIKEANKLNDFPDFNDEAKLGKGKDLIDTVSNLILIFNSPDLDFSGNNANDDDLLGDAYEYLMRHFATESGKSKGQFYTPAEVSRVLAKVIGINSSNSTAQTTAYDPTCGSGSLLLKVAEEAEKSITLYGQEKEIATANLARMNMILHGNPSAEIIADNTLSRPYWKDDNGIGLKTFDYIVANPPFSLKNWSNGVNVNNDEYGRFELGVPPEKNGDYTFLLHILKSLRTTGKGAVVLPHGVLFRGNGEAEIRKKIVKKGYIKGIIGLPANLFYGTGIPACILILDKEGAGQRKGIFMVDASKGFIKDGNKNRLQEKDIRKITNVFNNFIEVPKYSRMVSLEKIANEKNDYNLNIPRYIDTQEVEDIQDIDAHLFGGIPERDIISLQRYWDIFPDLKRSLFKPQRKGYYDLKVANDEIRKTIFNHPQFLAYRNQLQQTFDKWIKEKQSYFKQLNKGIHPKKEIADLGDSILKTFEKDALVNPYDMYQHLMAYWEEVMQDDFYTIAIDGWQAGTQWEREIIKGKKGKDGKTAKDKIAEGLEGVIGRIIPPDLLIQEYFAKEWEAVTDFEAQIENAKAELEEIQQETEVENGIFSDLEKVNLTSVKGLLKQRKSEKAPKQEIAVIENYIRLNEAISIFTKLIKIEKETIEKLVIELYPKLSENEIKDLVINKKWIKHLEVCLYEEKERMSQTLTQRIIELAERYNVTLPEMETALSEYESKVKSHLQKMGWKW
ncbi:type I restriction-modification system subunit M [Elizabethkingia anophelis]|uniref:type I restriction-modification system subunit M n=1 Tax=Elizabethkingia anophelis TaxID=1117645 RepID=UPI0011EA9A97|nr:type I restriction-modification system subunit M [Elizabethkingia anophelis]TYT29558.1 type I restriction-modification system subunit M [Elizabethkingia anophelis]UKY90913.1 type I restriction-modification system subunit M [Elizabethkingia anophelis]UKY98082.1 type I restriction-modification system subunit M [Elizabethkingia anophelis]